MASPKHRFRRLLAGLGIAVLTLMALFVVGRGVVEVVTLDPSDHASYRQSWGGPGYVGVLLVHAGPGLLILVVLSIAVVRRYLAHGRRRPADQSGPAAD